MVFEGYMMTEYADEQGLDYHTIKDVKIPLCGILGLGRMSVDQPDEVFV